MMGGWAPMAACLDAQVRPAASSLNSKNVSRGEGVFYYKFSFHVRFKTARPVSYGITQKLTLDRAA